MPPCYTFSKVCIPDSGMTPCAGAPGACPIQDWFWLLAAVVGVAVVIANGSGK